MGNEYLDYIEYATMMQSIFGDRAIAEKDGDIINLNQYILVKFDNFVSLAKIIRYNIAGAIEDSMVVKLPDGKWGILFKMLVFSTKYSEDPLKNIEVFKASARTALTLESFSVEQNTSKDSTDFFDIYDNYDEFIMDNTGFTTVIDHDAFNKLYKILV